MSKHNGHNETHWKAPTLMGLSLSLGIGVALSQHFFYHWLDGHATNGSETPFSQAVNSGIGTAMAFLVKSFLVFSIGVAYSQLFWRNLRLKEVKISRIDSLFAILSSVAEFFVVKLWIRFPLLLLVALISWLLPLSAVVAPATLTTRESVPLESGKYVMQAVPKLDFSRNSYAQLGFEAPEAEPIQWVYQQPQALVRRAALATSAGGSKLIAPVEAVNSSYTINFYGPQLTCENVEPKIYDDFNSYMWNLYLETSPFLYMAWTLNDTTLDPIDGLRDAIVFPENFAINQYLSFNNQTTALYVAVKPYVSLSSWEILRCQLFNSSYVVDFENLNGLQTSTVIRAEPIQGIKALGYLQDDMSTNQISPEETFNWQPNWQSVLGYQAILNALAELALGGIFLVQDNTIYSWGQISTTILSTTLAQTDPLYGIFSATSLPSNEPPGMASPSTPIPRNQTLKEGLEELFLNITLSLLSFEEFRLNYSDGGNHALTNVSVFTPHIVYKYSPRNLFIAYGLAILFSALIAALGAIVMYTADGTYSSTFSTVVRTTKGCGLDAIITKADQTGKDPLPEKVGNFRLRIMGITVADDQEKEVRKPEAASGEAEPGESTDPTNVVDKDALGRNDTQAIKATVQQSLVEDQIAEEASLLSSMSLPLQNAEEINPREIAQTDQGDAVAPASKQSAKLAL